MPNALDLASTILADAAQEQRTSGALVRVTPVAPNVPPAKTGPAPRSVVELTPVDQMTLEEIQAELRWFKPMTALEADLSDEVRERRADLWARLDAAVLPGWVSRWRGMSR